MSFFNSHFDALKIVYGSGHLQEVQQGHQCSTSAMNFQKHHFHGSVDVLTALSRNHFQSPSSVFFSISWTHTDMMAVVFSVLA